MYIETNEKLINLSKLGLSELLEVTVTQRSMNVRQCDLSVSVSPSIYCSRYLYLYLCSDVNLGYWLPHKSPVHTCSCICLDHGICSFRVILYIRIWLRPYNAAFEEINIKW